MFTTLQGRVASNPMLVPAPASMSTGRSSGFAEVLEQASAPQTPVDAPQNEAAEPEAMATAPAESATELAAEPAPAAELPTDTTTAEEVGDLARQPSAATLAADGPTEGFRTEATTAQQTTGNKAAIATNQEQAPWLAMQPAATAKGVAYAAPATISQAPVGSRLNNDGMLRGLEGAWSKQSSATRAATAAAGYRTSNAAAAQRMEMARESVFQQILLKLHEGGGEMRLRLDPPEFGELDLRLVLHEGNKLSLSIAAERQEMAQLLQKHLDQLRQTLETAGMQVTDAQVGTRSQQQGNGTSSPPLWQDADGEASKPQTSMAKSGGYLHADGLDFWV
jgi:flagellar hook-length control protein FliK